MRTPLKKNEEILLVTRTSWVVLIVPAIIVFINAAIAYFIVQYSNWFFILPAVAIFFFVYKWLERAYNIWVVTNFRVIDEYGLININTKESPLEKINNVSYSQGIWGRIFKYGDVEIQTAATTGETVYRMVEKPGLLKDTITTAQANYKYSHFSGQSNAAVMGNVFQAPVATSSNVIGTELEKLYDLWQKGILSEEEYQKAKAKLLQ